MTGNALTMDEARDYERRSVEPRVLSFAELKELIESGRVDQIPNNKFIPDKLSVSPSLTIYMVHTQMRRGELRRSPRVNPSLPHARNLGSSPKRLRRRQHAHRI